MTSSIGTVIIAILKLGNPLAVALVKEIVSILVVFFILVFAWPKLVDKTDKLQRLFPEGYSVAIPERGRASFMELVWNCHRDGTAPMLSRLPNRADVTPARER